MKPDIEIKNDTDWGKLRADKINVIVDPMIVRSADLWLQGRSGQTDESATEIWKALTKNIDSIEAFFDAFILSERLPLVDYGITFDSNIGFEPKSLYHRVNDQARGPVLRNVHVHGQASKDARQEAVNRLKTKRPAGVNARLIKTIRKEFSAFEHQWRPKLDDLGELSADEELVSRFQYGLVLFGYFSAKAQVGHIIQSRRAAAFASGALGSQSVGRGLDAGLRQKLKAVIESEEKRAGVTLDLPVCPSFLSYLMSKQPKKTNDLFKAAIKLQRSAALREYRDWRSKIVTRWQRYGQVSAETEADYRKAVRGVMRELGVDAPEPASPLQLGINVLFLSLSVSVDKLFGWVPGLSAGDRHVKMLMRGMRASYEQKKLTEAVHELWSDS